MGLMNPMVSMECDDEASMDAPMPYSMPDKPQFPYGLRICLTKDEMDKLDISADDAVVGGIVHLHALACITCVSQSDGPDGQCSRVELQIQYLAIDSEDAENAAYD